MRDDARDGAADFEGGRTTLNIRKQLVKRTIAGDVILVPVGDASLELKGLLTLNETGERMWDLLLQCDT